MYGRETYNKLQRQVPPWMVGLRLAESARSPQSIRLQAETERAMLPHPVLGGATRGKSVMLGSAHPSTFATSSVEGEKKKSPWPLLVIVGGVLWLAR